MLPSDDLLRKSPALEGLSVLKNSIEQFNSASTKGELSRSTPGLAMCHG